MSESQSVASSLPREIEKSGTSARSGKIGVAFDPSAGPGEPSTSKVSPYFLHQSVHVCISRVPACQVTNFACKELRTSHGAQNAVDTI